MTDTTAFTIAGIVLAPIAFAFAFAYWWTRFCIRMHRRWTR